MAQRAQWKGFIKFGEVSCGVGLYTAASTSERISFHTINKHTGNRVNRVFIDSDTGKEVEREDQTKGFEIENGQYIMIDPEEVAATVLWLVSDAARSVTGQAISISGGETW